MQTVKNIVCSSALKELPLRRNKNQQKRACKKPKQGLKEERSKQILSHGEL